ncbi:pyridoxal-5-phosphate-dependent protein subunit beta, partial [bacterium M00.F.Ca.ET.221.01.1.1]
TIVPAAETQWTRFLWLGRSLDDVLKTQSASEVPPAVGAAENL